MLFKTIHTFYGLTAMAEAESAGVPINLPTMAVGDGNGNPTDPQETDTQLVRERYRAAVNRVYQSPTDPKRFTAELVVPTDIGGFTMREVAVFDSHGSMFVVGTLPDTYKPTVDEGAFSDVVVRVDFLVSNAQIITLQVDPAIAVASQQWVLSNVKAAQIIPGGTVTQFLGKASNADGDYQWKEMDAINVTVDTVAEKQLLAANQTTVDLTVTTTYGLAVYVAGLRLDKGTGADEWQPDANIPTRLKLGKSYAANTRITLVNNEPAGSAPAPLERGNNLADVIDKAAGRTNLDVFSKSETRTMAPAGLVATFARSTAPTGWLKANGAAVSRTAYADLFAAIGTTHGAGDGFNTFNLPDLRGEFIRGWDDSRGVDGDRVLGSWQSGAMESHIHSATTADAGGHVHTGTTNSAGAHNHAASTATAGNHAHGAWTDAQGQHTHAALGSPGVGQGAAGPNSVMQALGSTNTTSAAGLHSHNVGVASAGDHTHGVSVGSGGEHSHNLSIASAGTHSHSITISSAGGLETRPRNVALLVCIKY